jgi:nucleoid-associated protein YgaU
MRRNATYLAASLALALAFIITGCKSASKKETSWNNTMDTSDRYADASEETTYEPETFPVYGAATPVETSYEPAPTTTTTTSSGPRYHTVAKKDTLYGLARTYYGDHRRWKEIYEVNRNVISDPNRILVGQRLVIP